MTKEITNISSREYKVIALLADGCTYEQIGAKLNWSEDKVSYVVMTLLNKLCAHHPFELISWAYLKGILK